MKIKRRTLRVEVPTVAMGDIAFNLLVFFVILARANDDSHLKWEPATAIKVESSGNSRVSITVDQENRLFLNGKEIGERDLAGAVERLLGSAPAGSRTVLLKIHKETQAARFQPVIEAVSQAGGEIVHVLEEERAKDG